MENLSSNDSLPNDGGAPSLDRAGSLPAIRSLWTLMKAPTLLITAATLAALAAWWFLVPSRHDKVVAAFESAQLGDSREIIRRWIGPPSRTEKTGKGLSVKEGLICESYSFFLTRYGFFYDLNGRLADKYMFTSE